MSYWKLAIFIGMLRSLLLAALALVSLSDHAKEQTIACCQQSGPIHLDKDGKRWADRVLRRMTTDEKIGQLFMIFAEAKPMGQADPAWIQLNTHVHKYHIGGLVMTVPASGPVLFKTQPLVAAEMLNRLQKSSPLPLIVAADFERGVAMRLNGVTVFPHAMAFGAAGALDNAETFGRITAKEARAIGVHWNFFPDADVNSNPANPIINTRAFGGDPGQVSDMVAAYIRGAHQGGMLTTAKHFPGHGDTATDSHLGLASVTGNRARLDTVELPPFRRAIASGVDAIMIAHVSVPALDPLPNHIATTSRAVVTGLLRNQLGFRGIIVTDSLGMGGLTRLYNKGLGRATVDAFKAGTDMLIVPPDIDGSFKAMQHALQTGEISVSQLDESVRKVLELKASLGLHKTRLVDLDKLPRQVAQPENLQAGQHIADEAMTLVRDNGKLLPLKASGTPGLLRTDESSAGARNRMLAVIFSDSLRTESGHMLEHQILSRVPDARVIYVDARSVTAMRTNILNEVDTAERVIAAVYVIPVAGKVVTGAGGRKNSVAMDEATGLLLQAVLQKASSRTVVLAMGNPYLVQDFPSIQNYLCAFSNMSVSETAAVKAAFGEIAIRGHLPVSIPGVASRGDGLQRPTQSASGGTISAQ